MCRAAERVERAWLRGLLDEVGDAKVRSALESGGGLCARHVRLLVDVAIESRETLGLGVVLEVLLSQARDELVGHRRRLWPPTRTRTGSEAGCGACEAVGLREQAYVALLLEAADAAVQRHLRDPRSALCRPHLAELREEADVHGGAAALERGACSQVDQLLAGVARSIAAHQVGSAIGPDAHEVLFRGAPDWLAGRAGGARTWAPGRSPRAHWPRRGRP